VRPDEGDELLAQGGFADPRLAREHDQHTRISRGGREGFLQLL
jgi:hypothetical protein